MSEICSEVINNRYLIKEKLGSGGMGSVFLVQDSFLSNSLYALKIIKPQLLAGDYNQQATESFRSEFEIMSRLKHPNLIRVYEFGYDKQADFNYIKMDYVSGKTLDQQLKIGRISAAETMEVMVQLLRVLQYIHSRGIIYRDIKPQNIIWHNGSLTLLDFGLSEFKKNADSVVRGTASCMAPELFSGRADSRSDIFAAGVLFYQLLSGENFYPESSLTSVIDYLQSEAAYQAARNCPKNSELSDEQLHLINRMTAFQPDKRYSDCHTVITKINSLLKQHFSHETQETALAYVLGVSYSAREDELLQLQEHLTAVSNHIMLLKGQQGCGKKRLLAEFIKYCQMQNHVCLSVSCTKDATMLFEPFIAIIAELLLVIKSETIQKFGSIFKTFLPDHPRLSGFTASTQQESEIKIVLLKDAILNLLLSVATDRDAEPALVLIFNDLHNLDSEGFNLLQELSFRLNSGKIRNLRLVASCNDDDFFTSAAGINQFADKKSVTTVRLPLLTLEKIEKYIEACFGQGNIKDSFTEQIAQLYARIGGNLYLWQELLKNLISDNLLINNSGKWQISELKTVMSAPLSLKAIMLKRLTALHLNRADELAFISLSLCRDNLPVNLAVKTAALNSNDSVKLLDGLVKSEILHININTDGSFYSFSQTLLKETVADSANSDDKTFLHRQIADLWSGMKSEFDWISNADLAQHFDYGGKHTESSGYYILAADDYSVGFNHLLQAEAIKKALFIAPALATPDLLFKAAMAYKNCGRWDSALELFDKVSDDNNQFFGSKAKIASAEIFFMKKNRERAEFLLDQAVKNAGNDFYLNCEILKLRSTIQRDYGEYDLAIHSAEKLLVLSLEQNFLALIIDACGLLCKALVRKSEFEKSLYYANLQLENALLSKNPKNLAEAYSSLSLVYNALSDYRKSLEYGHLEYEIALKMQNRQSMIRILNSMGGNCRRLGEYDRALELYQQVIDLAEENNDQNSINIVTGNMGIIYQVIGKLDLALTCFTQKVEYSRKNNQKPALLLAMNSLGNIYFDMNRIEEAQKAYLEQKAIAEELKDQHNLALAYLNLSQIDSRGKRYESAEYYIDQCLAISAATGNINLKVIALGYSCSLLLNLHRYPPMLKQAQMGLQLSRESGERHITASFLSYLGIFYLRTAKYREAETTLFESLQLFEEIGDIKDQLNTAFELFTLLMYQKNYQKLDKLLNDYLINKKIESNYSENYLYLLLYKIESAIAQNNYSRAQRYYQKISVALLEKADQEYKILYEITGIKIELLIHPRSKDLSLLTDFLSKPVSVIIRADLALWLYHYNGHTDFLQMAVTLFTDLYKTDPQNHYQDIIMSLNKEYQDNQYSEFMSPNLSENASPRTLEERLKSIQHLINRQNRLIGQELSAIKKDFDILNIVPQNDQNAVIENLKQLLQITKNLNSNLSLEHVLTQIVDLSVRFTDAERGILLMYDSKNSLIVKVARDHERKDLSLEKSAVPQSLLEKVKNSNLPVFESDLDTAGEIYSNSIISLKIRSVLCLPLYKTLSHNAEETDKQPSDFYREISGFLYVDSTNASSRNRFIGDNLDFLQTLGDQASIAVNNATIYSELKDLANSVDERNQELVVSGGKIENLKNYLVSVVESLPSMLLTINSSGEITGWNNSATLYTGITADQAINSKFWDVALFLEQFKTDFPKIIADKKKLFYAKKYCQLKACCDQQETTNCCNVSLIPFLDQNESSLIIIVEDITELERKEDQLRQIQKMETVGTLAGGLAHDFNNILSGIVGTVSLMKYRLGKKTSGSINPAVLQDYADTIEQSAQRAVDLVKQLLTLSRKQKLTLAPVDLNQAVVQVFKICRNSFPKNIDLIFNPLEELPIVRADAAQIEQVLLNLCVNGSHAMTIMRAQEEVQGGTLAIAINKIEADQQFALAHSEAQSGTIYYQLVVEDNGVGMNQQTATKIFDPFFTTKEEGKGTGLGLSMVYNIIKQHKGFIEVSSEPGVGTTFFIYLPAV